MSSFNGNEILGMGANISYGMGQNTPEGGEIFNDYENNKASDIYTHAEGFSTQALGDKSHAEGDQTIAEGPASHTEGTKTKTSGPSAHAEGSASAFPSPGILFRSKTGSGRHIAARRWSDSTPTCLPGADPG